MKSSILTFFLSLILATTLTHGAVITVGSGESIQTAVDGAADGDEIVLTYPGQYVGNVTVNGKGLTIRSLNQALTSVLGNFSVTGLTAGKEMNFQNQRHSPRNHMQFLLQLYILKKVFLHEKYIVVKQTYMHLKL